MNVRNQLRSTNPFRLRINHHYYFLSPSWYFKICASKSPYCHFFDIATVLSILSASLTVVTLDHRMHHFSFAQLFPSLGSSYNPTVLFAVFTVFQDSSVIILLRPVWLPSFWAIYRHIYLAMITTYQWPNTRKNALWIHFEFTVNWTTSFEQVYFFIHRNFFIIIFGRHFSSWDFSHAPSANPR